MESRNVLITKVQARASKILNSRCTLHPIITTSYTMPNGIVSHEAHQDLLQGHISRFIGLQLHFIEADWLSHPCLFVEATVSFLLA